MWGVGNNLSCSTGILKYYLLKQAWIHYDIWYITTTTTESQKYLYDEIPTEISLLNRTSQATPPELLIIIFILCWHWYWLEGRIWKLSQICFFILLCFVFTWTVNRNYKVDNSKLEDPQLEKQTLYTEKGSPSPLSQADRQERWDLVVKWMQPSSLLLSKEALF